MIFQASSLQDLAPIAKSVVDMILRGDRIFLLQGEMGAGKTTFVQAVCEQLGVGEAVSSPTFSLVNGYDTNAAGTVFHMDLYRLEKASDLEQIGFEEYLDSDQVCFIEWPELAGDRIDPPYVIIHIAIETPENIRIFKINRYDTVD